MAVRLHDFSPLVKSRVREAAIETTNAISIHYQNEAVKKLSEGGGSNIGSGGQSSPAGGPPAVDTGALRRSFHLGAPGSLNDPLGNGLARRVGTKLIYAKVQEFGGPDGGLIHMRDKLLLVPIGVEGKRFIRRYGKPKGAIRAQKLTLIKRPGKAPLLVKINGAGKGKGAHWTLIAVLKESVRVPARPYMRPAKERFMKSWLKVAARAWRLGLKKRGLT